MLRRYLSKLYFSLASLDTIHLLRIHPSAHRPFLGMGRSCQISPRLTLALALLNSKPLFTMLGNTYHLDNLLAAKNNDAVSCL